LFARVVLRDPEVQDLQPLGAVGAAQHQTILGLHVAMYHPCPMREIEPRADLQREAPRPLPRQPPLPLDHGREIDPIQPLHHVVGDPVVLTHVDHLHDVLVAQLRRHPRLAQKALRRLRIPRPLLVQHLDRPALPEP
jgi:hypothetical protein